MKRFILTSILLCSLVSVYAQGRFVKINTKDSKDYAVIKVSQTSEKTQIIGNISRTTVDLIVTNSSNRILEGEFEFPLEQGETVTGFALDINGKLRNAVAIEKEKGRQIFEEVVRKNVDPGLLEMTAGNNFKTRIYPIPAKGFRQIQIVYEKKLSSNSSQIKTDVAYTETIGKDTFFYYYPNLSAVTNKAETKKKLPDSIVVYYDVSDSGKNRNREEELSFLENYISVTKAVKLEAVTFSNAIHVRKNFNSVKDLIAFLRMQDFDGGTNLNLDFSKETAAQIILVSDGLHNFSKENSGVSKNYNREKMVAVTCSSSANYEALNQLAGEVVNLNEKKKEEAINQLIYRRIKLLSVDYDVAAFSQITPACDYAVSVSKDFCVSGILNKKSGKIKLCFGYDDKKPVVVKEFTVSAYETSECKEAENVSRLWAMEKIQELSLNYNEHKDEIIALAKKYTVVTPDTSLIVLETVNDYVRYGVEPPEELREEYNRIAGRNISAVKNNKESGIPAEVYKTFEEYRNWWKKSPKDFKNNKQKIKNPEAPILYNDIAPESLYETDDYAVTVNNVMERGVAASEPMATTSLAKTASASADTSFSVERKASVVLQAYNSKAEYLSVLKKTPEVKMYEKYLELKKDYQASPSFFMEVADYFFEEGLKGQALRILSNLAEMNLENTDVLRALGYKLSEWKEYELACGIFNKLVAIRPEVPQFLRDLGLAYNNAGETQKAIDTLWQLASKKWDSRYSQIQQVALNDLNSIISRSKSKLDTSKMDSRLLENFDVDIRVVLTWNTDDCDIDLWVTDPDGEKCFYNNKLTQNGGRMSRDFTQGYGPEEFAIKVAPNGKYKIQANYYANHQQKLLQPVIVQAEVYTNFGRANQTCQIMTLQLNDIKNTFDIGEITF